MKEYTILVVDDQKGIRNLITEALQEENYRVFSAGGGIEALAFLQKIKPDLIILDMKLPGMNGLEINKEVALLNPKIPVVLMTAYGEISLINKLKEHGIKYFLPKPFDVADLKKLVSSILQPQAKKIHA